VACCGEREYRSLSREERRERIIWAAKLEMLEKGLDEASMDGIAARAGTTKPTVYAHFKSKDELFAVVVEYIKEKFLGKLRSPEDYSPDPMEAVALFCSRFVELVCWRDAIGYQRVTLAAASRSPAMARIVYETLYAGACQSLASYLRAHKLVRNADRHAEILLWGTTGGTVIRHLYGVDESSAEMPDDRMVGAQVDTKRIREAVKLIASNWKMTSHR